MDTKMMIEAIDACRRLALTGRVATYIPELAKAHPEDLGIAVLGKGGRRLVAGEWDRPFTLQSISKPLVLLLALEQNGEEKVFEKVGKEPTGDAFNSIVKLETFKPHKPLNPMINAGAIAVTALIKGEDVKERFEAIHDYLSALAGRPLGFDERVYLSEKRTGNRNRALAYFMKDSGVIEGDVEEVLDLYFRQCSIVVTAEDIARMGSVLATGGVDPATGERLFSARIGRIVKSYMVTCGMYDGSGAFAIDVGIPAKSGVGGGIMGVIPGVGGIGVYGPALDERGNSVAGVALLKHLSEREGWSLFD